MTRQGYFVALDNNIVSGKCETIEQAEIELQNHHVLDLVSGGTDDERQYKIVSASDYDFYKDVVGRQTMCKLEKVVTSRRKTTVETV